MITFGPIKRWRRLAAGVASAVAAAASGLVMTSAFAADEALEPTHHHWHFAGPFGVHDRAQLQRGYQVYREVCAICHGMKFLEFRHLGERGAPFYDPEYPDPNDNPVVRALAAQFMITDLDDDGYEIERPRRPSDPFPQPFANDAQARAINQGAYPPDLTLITRARHHGPDYIYSLMLGYGTPPEGQEPPLGLYYNPWFPGGQIAMPPQLMDGRVIYADGQPEPTMEQIAEDVVAFFDWAADPHQEARKRLGFMVVIYLALFSVIMWFSYKQIWRNVKH